MNQGASLDLQSQHPSTVAGIFCIVLLGLGGVVSWLYLPIEGRFRAPVGDFASVV